MVQPPPPVAAAAAAPVLPQLLGAVSSLALAAGEARGAAGLEAVQQHIDTARSQAVSRQHEASEMQQRVAAVDVQRACAHQEYEVCRVTLQRLHALCEEHAVELKAKTAQQQQAQQQLDHLGAEAAAAEAHMAAQLAQLQQVHLELHAARDEAAVLKAAHVPVSYTHLRAHET